VLGGLIPNILCLAGPAKILTAYREGENIYFLLPYMTSCYIKRFDGTTPISDPLSTITAYGKDHSVTLPIGGTIFLYQYSSFGTFDQNMQNTDYVISGKYIVDDTPGQAAPTHPLSELETETYKLIRHQIR
jgi:hypothetical protein